MKNIIKYISILVFIFGASIAFAQAPPPPNNGATGNGGTTPVGGGASLGGGLIIMIAAASIYAGKQYFRKE